MPKITVTFHEEGAAQSGFEIEAELASRLDLYVAGSNGYWTSKSDMFMKVCQQHIVEPALAAFPIVTPAIIQKKAALDAARADLEAELASQTIRRIEP